MHSVRLGYASGDLAFQANVWNGAENAGEFGVTGSQFTPNNAASPVSYEVYVRDSTMVPAATTARLRRPARTVASRRDRIESY